MSKNRADVHAVYSFTFLLIMSCGIFIAIKESNDTRVQADVLPNLAKSSLPPLPQGELVEEGNPPVPTKDMEFNPDEEDQDSSIVYKKKSNGYHGGSRAAKSYGYKEFLRRNK